MRVSRFLLTGFLLVAAALSTQAQGAADPTLLTYIQADKLQAAALTGAGIKIGVVSDGVVGIEALEQDGTLPSVTIYQNDQGASGQDGPLMLQVVHQIAPAAQLYFCSEDFKEAQCVEYFVSVGVTVAVSDLANFPSFSPNDETAEIENLEAANPALIHVEASGDNGPATFYGAFVGTSLTVAGQTIQAMDWGKASGVVSNTSNAWSVQPGASIAPAVIWSDDPTGPPPSSNDKMGLWVLNASGQVLASDTGTGTNLHTIWTNSGTAPVTVNIIVGVIQQNNTQPLYVLLGDQAIFTGTTYGYSSPIGGVAGVAPFDPLTLTTGASAKGSNVMETWSAGGPAVLIWSGAQTGATDPFGFPVLSYTRLPQPELSLPLFLGYQRSI